MTDDAPNYADEWDQLTEKEILMGVLAELQQIRLLLQGAESGDSDATAAFVCDRCGESVPDEKRERHATRAHNAHPSMAAEMFSPVE